LNINDKVIVKSDNFWIVGLNGQTGTIVKIAEKTPFPYQVKFAKATRWLNEEELTVVE
jgi:hypothetical protein